MWVYLLYMVKDRLDFLCCGPLASVFGHYHGDPNLHTGEELFVIQGYDVGLYIWCKGHSGGGSDLLGLVGDCVDRDVTGKV